jgi:hypothetical protein
MARSHRILTDTTRHPDWVERAISDGRVDVGMKYVYVFKPAGYDYMEAFQRQCCDVLEKWIRIYFKRIGREVIHGQDVPGQR